jgi:hypothetical protein
MIQQLLGYTSGLCAFLFYFGIIRSIIRDQSKANRTTWSILGINDFLILCSSFSLGARNTLWVPLVYVLCGLTCLFLSIKNDRLPLSAVDKGCLAGSVIAWILWAITKEPFIALALGVLVNTLGVVPTWRRTYLNPDSQPLIPWIIISMAGGFMILSLEQFTLPLALFPFDSLLISTIETLLIFRGRI